MPLSPALRREFRQLAVINVLSNLTVPLSGLADTAMLGRLPGAVDLAGVALAGLLFDLLYFGLGFLRMGTTGPVAQAHGRRDFPAQAGILARSGAVAVVCGLVILALRHPLDQLTFGLLSGSAEVERAGSAYLLARVWGAPATLLNLVLIGWFLGRSQSGSALVVTVVTNGVNIAGNALFILHWGYGAAGAGWATALGQFCGLLVALALALPMAEIRISWSDLSAAAAWSKMFALHRDIFVRTLCLLAAFTLFTELSARLGTINLAANAVLLRVVSVGSYWIDGIAYATETLVGRLHGAAQLSVERALLRWALGLGFVSAAFIALPPALAPGPVLFWLVEDPQVRLAIADSALWLFPVLLLGSAAYVLDGYFLGRAAGPVLRNSMVLSLVVFLVPAMSSLATHSVPLLWFALTLLMLARAGSLGFRARRISSE